MNILIYSDNVSSNHALYYALGKLRGKRNIYFVNANELRAGALDAGTDLFVMPGGASRYKSAKLNGAGYAAIKRYVAEGGRYLGICAGAYSACEVTHWARDRTYEILTRNELAFFPGLAEGPIEAFAKAENYNGTDSRIVHLNLQGERVRSLYLGGCRFVPRADSGYEVLATFADLPGNPPAVVHGDHGEGRWLLCSTHPEFDAEALALMDFDVVGNDYEHIGTLGNWSDLSLDALERMLVVLMAPRASPH